MAYMNQQRKAELAPAIKAICKKYNVKASLSVYHYSTLCLTIQKSPIDFIANYNINTEERARRTNGMERFHAAENNINVNGYWFHEHFTGEALEFLKEVHAAMNVGNHDRSDTMTDYFDVGWYVDISIGRWNKPYVLAGSEVAA